MWHFGGVDPTLMQETPLFIQPPTPSQPTSQPQPTPLTPNENPVSNQVSTQSAFFCIGIFFCLQKGEQDDFLYIELDLIIQTKSRWYSDDTDCRKKVAAC